MKFWKILEIFNQINFGDTEKQKLNDINKMQTGRQNAKKKIKIYRIGRKRRGKVFIIFKNLKFNHPKTARLKRKIEKSILVLIRPMETTTIKYWLTQSSVD